MNPSIGTAPGKIILFGEHAVVYGHPAIAVPITQVCATVAITASPDPKPGIVHIVADDINLHANLADLPAQHPLTAAIHYYLEYTGVDKLPACAIRISSTIPVASGMGSGAAVSAALFRALAAFQGHSLSADAISNLSFEVEKIHHGTPSGIDNTVIVYGMPVYFIKGEAPQTFTLAKPIHIIIGDTGIASSTAEAVGDVHKGWLADPARFNTLFDAIGEITRSARYAIEQGQIHRLGKLMDENHALLRDLGVSSPELENLVEAARQAGALGAKLSGGGRGGNMIALADASQVDKVTQALLTSGAHQTISTIIKITE